MNHPVVNCFKLLRHFTPWACCLDLASAGSNIAAKIAIIAMTTSNSIRVNALALAALWLRQCGSLAQAQPTISGAALPSAPNNQNGFDVGSVQFQGVVPPNSNQLSFQVSSGTGVTALTVKLTATTLSGASSST